VTSPSNAGRIVGGLVLVQMAGGFVVNFVLEAPLIGSPGFLVAASSHAGQIALAAVLGLALGALAVGIAVTIYPHARSHAPALSLWLLIFAAACLAAAVSEQISVMSMVSVSEAFAKAPATEQGGFLILRISAAATRNWSHYIGLSIAGLTILVQYATLYRGALVPRALAAFGMAAALLQIIAVLMPLFGHNVVFLLLAPLGVSQLVLALWLMVRGLKVTQPGGERGTTRNDA
jgi:hypothetical protein